MYIVLTNYDLTMSFPWKLLILIGLFELQYLLGWDDGYDWKCGDWWLTGGEYRLVLISQGGEGLLGAGGKYKISRYWPQGH